ncbi:MAG: sigma 54-interacting transcriptional regulator [Ignavibacterium album]|uniref:sigma-54-dependent transcriptional regulator n=1 Tax=Ignavibacterium album TaxID=591197 RepID=UPI0026EF93A8|nr:sigma 54-interacting transcriptional regulator [Ignavibacterium album]MCX8106749.1 sigma 54-interacting transcriptional regulator [Ignavibacterium album]
MIHKSNDNLTVKINIYIINANQIFIDATTNFIKNFETIDKNKYEIITKTELSFDLFEKLRIWDVIIIDSNAINNWEEIELIYNTNENIILFSDNYDIDINLKIYENNMNILILPRLKSLDDIKIYEEYLFTIIARSNLIFRNVKNTKEKILSFNDSDNNKSNLVVADKLTFDSIEKLKKIAMKKEYVNILFHGPTGTGKNVLAKYFHYLRAQNKGVAIPYAHFDVSEFPPGLINSELFGHKKGSFTGAVDNKVGIIENAQKGILHIDELGNSTEFQSILLKLIEQRKYKIVGGTEEKKFEGDIIASTNVDINNNKNFREDLIDRFTYRIKIPALKDRPRDLGTLIDFYEESYLKSINKSLNSKAKFFLRKQDWPRNIRQLERFFRNCTDIDNSEIKEEDAKNIYLNL